MSKAEYAIYLRSREWAARRLERLKSARYACALNVSHRSQLEVHHRTYDRIGHELPEDLVVLCARCHRRFHDLLPAIHMEPTLPFDRWSAITETPPAVASQTP